MILKGNCAMYFIDNSRLCSHRWVITNLLQLFQRRTSKQPLTILKASTEVCASYRKGSGDYLSRVYAYIMIKKQL